MDETFVQAIAELHPKSFGWALACCDRQADDAAEVLQDAYEKVLSGRARYDGRSALKTWLFGVIRFTAKEHRRRSVVRMLFPKKQRALEPPHPLGGGPDSEAAAQQVAGAIGRALAELSPKQREVLHLVFYEDLSIAEAAEVMGVALGTARLHYDRGKKALADTLRKRGLTPP